MTSRTVHHEQVAALFGTTTPVRTRWAYRTDEPYAVTVSFCAERGKWVEWVFARDLLIEGLEAPAGLGDLRVRPSEEDDEVVLLDISSPNGDATFELDREGAEEFLANTLDLVPAGAECEHFDVDRLIDEVSQG